MIVILRWALPDKVIVDHRPMESEVIEEVRLEWLPMTKEIVPPGLKSVTEGIELVEVDSL